MTIAVTDSADPVASGDQLDYNITVTNTGGAKVSNVVVTNQLNGLGGIGVPPMYQIQSDPTKVCTQNSNLVTCDGGEMPGFSSWTIRIRGIVTAPNGTVINNTVQVTATKSAQTFTVADTEYTDVQSNEPPPLLPDLSISKTGPTSVEPNSPMTYILTVYNNGTVNASNIRVTDTLPAGLTGVTVSGTSLFVCNYVAPTVTCDGGSLTAAANATITINAMSPPAAGTITNTASVDPNNTIVESNELNNVSAIVNTEVGAAPPPPANELTITKTGPEIVVPGELVTYTIVVTNPSSFRSDYNTVVDGTQGLEATSIVASQTVSGGTIGNNGYGCTVQAAQVTCSIFKLESGGTWTVTYSGTVIAAAGSTILNTATVNGNIKNVGVSATTTFQTTVKPAIDLSITKADQPDPVCARSWPTQPFGAPAYPAIPPLLGDPVCLGGLEYTFVIGNSGINDATNVVIRDPLPTGVVFDSFQDTSGAGFTCAIDPADPVPNTVVCSGGTIGAESTETVKLLVVAPPDVGSITNTVYVDPHNAIFEADELNNSFTINTNVSTGIDLAIVKYDSPVDPPGAPNVTDGFDPIATSGTQTYTIFVDNLGPQDATNIKVRDILPADTIFLETEETNGFTCTYLIGPHVVECTGGSLKGTANEFYPPFGAPGDDVATIKIRVFAQPYVGTMLNEVRVDPFNEIAEVNEANNIEFESTTVTTGDAGEGSFNELTVAKTQVSPDPAVHGGNKVAINSVVTWNVVVTNTGTDPALNVALTDTLPAGFTFISALDTGGPTDPHKFVCLPGAGNTVNCSGATLDGTLDLLAGPAARTIVLKAFSSSVPGEYTNTAFVDPSNAIDEGNETNNAAVATVAVSNGGPGPWIDLSVDKQESGGDTVVPGGPLTYTLVVSNNGEADAFNVTVADVLPAHTTYYSAADTATPPDPGQFTCAHSAGIITCTGGMIPAGGSRSIFVVAVAPTNLEPFELDFSDVRIRVNNQAFVDPTNQIAEGNEINNSDAEDTEVRPDINLTVVSKEGPSTANQNQEAEYEITVKNEKVWGDGQIAFDAVVVDYLPVGLIPLSVATDESTMACQIFENPVNFVQCVGDLEPDQDVVITVTVFITAESGALDNEACIDPNSAIAESNELDNCKTKTTQVEPPPAPNLIINKAASTGTVTPGQTFEYTVTVSNVGTAPVPAGITITDVLPSEVTYVSAVATNGFTCSEAAGTVTCTDNGGGLAPGAFTVVTIQVTVNPMVTGSFDNEASVTGGTENETDTVTTNVGGAAVELILVDVTDTPDPVALGGAITYTIVATNAGTTDANGLDITQTFDDMTGLSYSAGSGSQGFTCSFSSPTVTCTGNLLAGQSTVLTIVLETSAPATVASSTILVDSSFEFLEVDEANNIDIEVTTIDPSICQNCIELVLGGILASPDPVANGGQVTYNFHVANVGDLATSADPDPGTDELVIAIDVDGDFNEYSAITANIPGFTCAVDTTPALGQPEIVCTKAAGFAPGEGVVASVTVTADTAADPSVLFFDVVVDPGNLVTEFNESNNTGSKLVEVDTPPPGP